MDFLQDTILRRYFEKLVYTIFAHNNIGSNKIRRAFMRPCLSKISCLTNIGTCIAIIHILEYIAKKGEFFYKIFSIRRVLDRDGKEFL